MDVLHGAANAGLGKSRVFPCSVLGGSTCPPTGAGSSRLERSADARSRGVPEHPTHLSQGEELRRPSATTHVAAALGARTHAVTIDQPEDVDSRGEFGLKFMTIADDSADPAVR